VCSLLFNKDVEQGMRIIQVLTPPAVFFCTWYLARWLFDARRGFVALLLVGTNMLFVMLSVWSLPSILANAIVPILLVFFLRRRLAASATLLALALYAHMGVGALTVLGLLIFSVWRREYLRFFLGVGFAAAILAFPWYSHIWVYRDWLGNPMARQIAGSFAGRLAGVYMKMKWLLMLDLLMVLLVVRAWRMIPWFETRYRLLLSMFAGFAPMFIEYGGRFFCHTVQLWAIVAAVPLVRFLSPPLRMRRVALFMVLALIAPTLMLAGQEGSARLRMHPMFSGWTMLSLIIGSGNGVFGDAEEHGKLSYAQAVELGQKIKEMSTPDQILHIVGEGPYQSSASLAVTLGYHADRRIDTAAWPEVRPADADQAGTSAADARGCYISRNPGALPKGLPQVDVGRYHIAVGPPPQAPSLPLEDEQMPRLHAEEREVRNPLEFTETTARKE
jgi:hypothetical protein